jgi:hypothetical protein
MVLSFYFLLVEYEPLAVQRSLLTFDSVTMLSAFSDAAKSLCANVLYGCGREYPLLEHEGLQPLAPMDIGT